MSTVVCLYYFIYAIFQKKGFDRRKNKVIIFCKKHKMISELFDCYCLFENDLNGSKFIVTMMPNDYDFQDSFPSLLNNVFVNTDHSQKPIIFFSFKEKIAYALQFMHDGHQYALMFASNEPLYQLFYLFLCNFHQNIVSNKDSLQPTSLFTYFTTVLNAWAYFDNKKMIHALNYDTEYDERTEHEYEHTLCFNPFLYFTDLQEIWENVLARKQICVYSSDPNLLSKAALSLTVLTLPFLYREEVFISLEENEEPLREILENENKNRYAIIATSCKSIAHDKNIFPILLEPQYTDKQNAKKEYKKWIEKSKKFYSLIDHIIEIKLLENPLFELFGNCPLDLNLFRYVKQKTLAMLPDLNKAKEFGHTKTFQEWYKSIKCRSAMREAVINLSPELQCASMTIDDLNKTKDALMELFQVYTNDVHFEQVLKRHLTVIEQLINNKRTL